ncbi:MAG: ABC transporter permease subunit [Anaerolineales bacterium]
MAPSVPARPFGGSLKWGLRLLSLTVFLVVWEGLGRSLDSLLLPTASETIATLVRLTGTGELWQALWLSNQALVMGYLAALVMAIPLGLAIGRWRKFEKPIDLYLNLFLVTPVSALIPLFIMALGLGTVARAAVVFVFSAPIVAVNTRAGLRGIDPRLIEMARSFLATEMQLWRKVLLPGALPAVISGVRLGLARAISGMVAVELLLISVGLGRLILRYQADFEAASVYAVVLVVLAEAVLLIGLLRLLEKRLSPQGGTEGLQ